MKAYWSIGALAFFLLACVRDNGQGANLQVGDSLPLFCIQMEDGTTLKTADLLDSPSLLIFFHTSCSDCRATLPRVQKLFEEYGEQCRFVAVSREQSTPEVRAWWDANGITLPFSGQKDRSVYSLFATTRIPRVYVVDDGGIVRYSYDDNPCPEYAQLKENLEKIL